MRLSKLTGKRLRHARLLLLLGGVVGQFLGCNEPITSSAGRCPDVTELTSPADDQVFRPGREIILAGKVQENQTADLATLFVKWSINGTLENGSAYEGKSIKASPDSEGNVTSSVSGLEEGAYSVRLVGLDTAKEQECKSELTVSFRVANQAPSVDLEALPAGLTVVPGAEIALSGVVSDPDIDDPPKSLALSVSDALEDAQAPVMSFRPAVIADDGSFTLVIFPKDPGQHSVFVRVTDVAGDSGADGPLYFTVRDCDSLDYDGDSFSDCEGDCDETDPAINPQAVEKCGDFVDNNCDGAADGGDGALDADEDGYDACIEGNLQDCDDSQSATYPGAAEFCDGEDNNCDGVLPSAELDEDADGYIPCKGDCDDGSSETYPGAVELCDGEDNSCDTSIPSAEQDRDKDGTMECETPGDCNDLDNTISPYLPEICQNGKDDNCNGKVDEEEDWDRDGYTTCSDCDDRSVTRYPGAMEGPDTNGDGIPECDLIDNDCDGQIDDGTSCVDDDGDGFKDDDVDKDCDDFNPYTYPGAVERSDLQDNNCDGSIEGTLSLERAHVRLYGPMVNARIADAVSGQNDVNGDGIEDLLVGASKYDQIYQPSQGRGAAFVVYGAKSGWETIESTSIAAHSQLLYEEEPGAYAGEAVAMAGDMNGDGLGDFAVGAAHHASASGANNVGRVYLIFGRTDGWNIATLDSASASRLEPPSVGTDTNNMYLGAALAGNGDVNDDGYDDLLIGMPWNDQTEATGWLFVLPGQYEPYEAKLKLSDSAVIAGLPGSILGSSVAISGRNNADGIPDILAGSSHTQNSGSGSVFFIEGDAGFVVGGQYTIGGLYAPEYWSTEAYNYLGSTVSGNVDIDNDGFDDLLTSRRNLGSSQNIAHAILGRATLPISNEIDYVPQSIRFTASLSGLDECPCAIVGLGDMNGDELGDFAIGVSRNDENGHDAGKIYIFHGRESRQAWGDFGESEILDVSVDEADLVIYGSAAENQAGEYLSATDLNGDGRSDLVVGVPEWGEAEARYGQLYVVFGYPAGKNPPL